MADFCLYLLLYIVISYIIGYFSARYLIHLVDREDVFVYGIKLWFVVSPIMWILLLIIVVAIVLTNIAQSKYVNSLLFLGKENERN